MKKNSSHRRVESSLIPVDPTEREEMTREFFQTSGQKVFVPLEAVVRAGVKTYIGEHIIARVRELRQKGIQ